MQALSVEAFHQVVLDDALLPSVALLDVRSRDEYREHHIPGVTNIPLSELAQHVAELKDKTRIYIHCLSGGRSRQAVMALAQLGLQGELFNIEGGLMAWEAAGYPLQRGE